MKKITILFALIMLTIALHAQDKNSKRALPKIDLKTSSGSIINSSTFDNNGKPIIIDFWATWCKPCVEELNTINDVYGDWQKETGVKMIIISVDDVRTMQRVAPFVNARNWTYESYVDPNGDFKREMNVNMPPQTFVLNGNKEIVWQHVGYSPGDEDELLEAVRKATVTPTK
jgi:cytochrome c biogenesis protein CcmG/thiol:disulfide interchange protein DsbE